MLVLLPLLLVVAAPAAMAQRTELPRFVTSGLEAYRAAGADSAIAVWFETAPFNSPDARETMRRAFGAMQSRAGRMVGHDVITVKPVGTHVRRIYTVVHFERGPGYLYLETYLAPDGWMLQHISFNDDPTEVFPATLLAP